MWKLKIQLRGTITNQYSNHSHINFDRIRINHVQSISSPAVRFMRSLKWLILNILNTQWITQAGLPWTTPTSHRSSFVQSRSPRHSTRRFLRSGARTPRSPGPSRCSCWVDLCPSTCIPQGPHSNRSVGTWMNIHTYFRILRCGQRGPVHPFPLSFNAFIRQSDPHLRITFIQAVDEGLRGGISHATGILHLHFSSISLLFCGCVTAPLSGLACVLQRIHWMCVDAGIAGDDSTWT